MHPHEAAIIEAFIAPARRARWREMLELPGRRRRFLDRLSHCRDLDPRYAVAETRNCGVLELLRLRGAPRDCYLLSAAAELDGRELPLSEALTLVEEAGWGTIVGCIPGRLAWFHDESGERSWLLERTPDLKSRKT